LFQPFGRTGNQDLKGGLVRSALIRLHLPGKAWLGFVNPQGVNAVFSPQNIRLETARLNRGGQDATGCDRMRGNEPRPRERKQF
jgi:hypothetical protein